MASEQDFFRWAESQQIRFEKASRLPIELFDEQGRKLAQALRESSPVRSGRLARSWRWENAGGGEGVVWGAQYARIVDKGGYLKSARPAGFLIPLRGMARRGNFVTVLRRIRGLSGFVIDRETRKIVAVRKKAVSIPARPYIDRTRQSWRQKMLASVRKGMKNAVLGRGTE